jgi:hypothetical protein
VRALALALALMWMGAALVGCRGRKSVPETMCAPVDALIQPLESERAELPQKYPPSSPERWVERALIDADAAVAIEEADLPSELSDAARADYVALLRELSEQADALAGLYNAIADFDKAQDTLRERIDEYSTGMKTICEEVVEDGCTFTPPLEPDPEGTVESLRAYVASSRTSHVADERVERLWQLLLDALDERVASMEEETTRTAEIAEREAAFAAAEAREPALLVALVAGCPLTPVAPSTELTAAPAGGGLPPVDGEEGYNFAQPIDPSLAPGQPPDGEVPRMQQAVPAPEGGPPPSVADDPLAPPPGEIPPGEQTAEAPAPPAP